jgi:hypothetical protein
MLLLHFRDGLSLYVIVRQRQAPRFPHGWLKISSSLCAPTCIIVSRFEMTYPAANGVSNKTSQLMEVPGKAWYWHVNYSEDDLLLREFLVSC